MNRDAGSVGLGLLGGAFGFTVGLSSMAAGLLFAVTGWTIFGIASAYYAVGGFVVGALFFLLSIVARRKHRGGV
jgi:hypothetical protein